MVLGFPCLYILLYNLSLPPGVVRQNRFALLPLAPLSFISGFYCAHTCRLYAPLTYTLTTWNTIVKGETRQRGSSTSYQPSRGAKCHPPRDVAVDDEAPVSKMKGLAFQCRSPRTHAQCTRTLGTKHRKNSDLQVCLSKFVAFSRHYCGLGL